MKILYVFHLYISYVPTATEKMKVLQSELKRYNINDMGLAETKSIDQ